MIWIMKAFYPHTTETPENIICFRHYKNFHRAFSALVNRNSEFWEELEEKLRILDVKEMKSPVTMGNGSVDDKGNGDDFYFKYANGVVISIETIIIK